MEFSYDDVGNVLSINDGSGAPWPAGAKSVSRSFSYDAAYRLTRVDYDNGNDIDVGTFLNEAASGDRHPVAERIGSRRVQRQSFATNWQGNVVSSKDDETLRFDRSLGGILNGVDRAGNPHGPNQLIDADGIHATYDDAGNLTTLSVSRPTCWSLMPSCSHLFQYDWNEIGELSRARRWDFAPGPVPAVTGSTGPTWDLQYAYTEGRRILTSITGAGSTSHNLDPFATLQIVGVSYSSSTSSYTIAPQNQIGYAGGVSRIFLDRSGVLPLAGSSRVHVYFNITDYLGSAAFSIDKDSGEVTERASYQPNGALDADYRPKRWKSAREDFKFTGKQDDIETGTIYFGARYYSAHLGRFLSPDRLAIHALKGDSNPYSYVGGRVTRAVDMFGLWTLEPRPCTGGESACYEMIEDKPGEARQFKTEGFDPERSTRYVEVAPEDVPYTSLGSEGSSAGGVPVVRHTVEVQARSNSEIIAANYPAVARIIDAARREDILVKYVAPVAMAGVTTLASGAAVAAEAIVDTAAPTARSAATFSSPDPLVGDLANEIESMYPGHVRGVNVKFVDVEGKVRDHDILLDNAVLQVKGGRGADNILLQLQRSEQNTGLPAIGYAPIMAPRAMAEVARQGGLITGNKEILLIVIAPP